MASLGSVTTAVCVASPSAALAPPEANSSPVPGCRLTLTLTLTLILTLTLAPTLARTLALNPDPNPKP